MVFVDESTAAILTPPDFTSRLWLGLLSIAVTGLSVLQLKVNWQERSESHGQAARLYTLVKRQATYVLAEPGALPRETCSGLFREYDLAGQIAVLVPDGQFLRLKQKHLQKVLISRLLDRHVGIHPCLASIKLFFRDAFRKIPLE
jgi:hypothetical protein